MVAGFLPLQAAQEALGVERRTLLSRIRERGIEVYENPLDRRVRLIRRRDLRTLRQPQPIARDRETSGEGASRAAA
jgi:hypothetical protein